MRFTFENVVGRRFILVLMAALFAFGMVACGDADDDADSNNEQPTASLEVAGTWQGDGYEEVITDTQWGFSPLVKFDNAKRVAYTKNADDSQFNPGKFGKIVWTPVVDGSFYYCTIEYDLDTLEDAENSVTVADESDKDASGCGPFPWTKLTKTADK